jgi:Fe-S-cluster containining protein
MHVSRDIPVPYRIIALMHERERLLAYPVDELAGIIRTTGFRCTCCGSCCTRSRNNHVFLLDRDVTEIMRIDPKALEPAPGPEFCDGEGTLYVSGYAVRTNNDRNGSCWFLEDRRCSIYGRRFSVCRTYPHTLRWAPDESGNLSWALFSSPEPHGCLHQDLIDKECIDLAREVKEYENALITHQIEFLEMIQDYFSVHHLMHDSTRYHHETQRYQEGEEVMIRVFSFGDFDLYRIRKGEYIPVKACS